MSKIISHWDQCGPLSNILDIITKKIICVIFSTFLTITSVANYFNLQQSSKRKLSIFHWTAVIVSFLKSTLTVNIQYDICSFLIDISKENSVSLRQHIDIL